MSIRIYTRLLSVSPPLQDDKTDEEILAIGRQILEAPDPFGGKITIEEMWVERESVVTL